MRRKTVETDGDRAGGTGDPPIQHGPPPDEPVRSEHGRLARRH